jgi:hypothetical protein
LLLGSQANGKEQYCEKGQVFHGELYLRFFKWSFESSGWEINTIGAEFILKRRTENALPARMKTWKGIFT